jgi:hypothetical protein
MVCGFLCHATHCCLTTTKYFPIFKIHGDVLIEVTHLFLPQASYEDSLSDRELEEEDNRSQFEKAEVYHVKVEKVVLALSLTGFSLLLLFSSDLLFFF